MAWNRKELWRRLAIPFLFLLLLFPHFCSWTFLHSSCYFVFIMFWQKSVLCLCSKLVGFCGKNRSISNTQRHQVEITFCADTSFRWIWVWLYVCICCCCHGVVGMRAHFAEIRMSFCLVCLFVAKLSTSLDVYVVWFLTVLSICNAMIYLITPNTMHIELRAASRTTPDHIRHTFYTKPNW